MQVYLVGGAVRDALLGLPVKERDWVVVGGTREVLLRMKYREVGRDFPVFLHPDTHEEYALARLERKVAPRYPGATLRSRRASAYSSCVSGCRNTGKSRPTSRYFIRSNTSRVPPTTTQSRSLTGSPNKAS